MVPFAASAVRKLEVFLRSYFQRQQALKTKQRAQSAKPRADRLHSACGAWSARHTVRSVDVQLDVLIDKRTSCSPTSILGSRGKPFPCLTILKAVLTRAGRAAMRTPHPTSYSYEVLISPRFPVSNHSLSTSPHFTGRSRICRDLWLIQSLDGTLALAPQHGKWRVARLRTAKEPPMTYHADALR